MKAIIYLATVLLIYSSTLPALSDDIFSESVFYSASHSSPNLLYVNNTANNNWTIVGETGTNNLKALAYNNENGTLYGINEGVLGTLNLQTGQFSALGSVISGEGAYGEIILNNIEALTYDPFSKLLFAVHRINGEEHGTNDLFFKINPQTGAIVKHAMFDFKERRFDYMPIPEILKDAVSIKDILGITINPLNYNLVALHTQNGYSSISKLNKRSGEIEEILYNSNSSFSDIAYDSLGNLYAVIGNNNEQKSNTFVSINTQTNIEDFINNIAGTSTPVLNFQSLTGTGVNMQHLDNDIALRFTLSPLQENPAKQGSIVSFDLTVFNQGELNVDEVRLSVKTDKNNAEVLKLGLEESSWIQFGDRIYGSFKDSIEPGENFNTSFQVELKDDFKGTMTFYSEIFHVYNHNITNEIGKYRPLSDIDSYYDDINNETTVLNDEINGSGAAANEDEDDHDLAIIEVERADNLIFSPCYTVSSQENADNVLFEFNPETEKWIEVGITGGLSIEAIATDPVNNLIYAVDGGTFGTINTLTGKFNPYSTVGIGEGAYGNIFLDNIKGLTYDPVNEIMYAVHRIEGEGPGTNDVLFQIDVSTGGIIPVAMQDPNTGSPVDYVIVPEVFPPTDLPDFYDVDDIAYNPYTGQFFAVHNQFGIGGATISVLNPANGTIEALVYGISDENDLEGIGFTSLGELYGTQGDMGLTEEERNNFLNIDLATGTTTLLGKIDPGDGKPPVEKVDFEAFDCFTAYNDLALRMIVDPSTEQPVSQGNNVTFLITIFNQGVFANTDIQLINYIPTGLILSDSYWTDLNDGTAIYTYNKSLEPGTLIEIPISFIVDPNFTETSLTNTAEILTSYNPQVVDTNGNLLQMPDWDSWSNEWNEEFNVVDNEINGGGPNANQDEDDHDIALLQIQPPVVENNLPAIITVNSELCNTGGSIKIEILSTIAPPYTHKWFVDDHMFFEGTIANSTLLIDDIYSGIYNITITDALNRISTFEVMVPLLSELDGNFTCNNLCPAYLVVPNGEIFGHFRARNEIEIQGYIKQSKTALFDICR